MKKLKNVADKTRDLFNNLLKSIVKIIVQSIGILFLVFLLIYPIVYLLTIPVSTQVQVDLVVDRVSFRMADATDLRQSVKFHSVRIKEFEKIEFVDNMGNPFSITGKDERFLPNASVTTVMPDDMNFGMLHRLSVAKDAKITLSVKPGEKLYQTLNIAVENIANSASSEAVLRHRGAFQVETRHCKVDSPNFEVAGLSRRYPMISVVGKSDWLRMVLSMPTDQSFDILPSGLAVTDLDWFWDDMENGERVVKTAVKRGTISYPNYPNVKPVSFGESNVVDFADEDVFKVGYISTGIDGLKVRLNGLAEGAITTHLDGFSENAREYRLTRADTIAKASKFREVMFNILLWIIPIIIGVVGIVTINVVKVLPDGDK
ncbi:hypothetical protein QUF74_04065 [Candidatus Halobeggiatoa sp. HSG11]|nr:hypothetical protein [Candidatus Halobeggiatoa sp. HSG11]